MVSSIWLPGKGIIKYTRAISTTIRTTRPRIKNNIFKDFEIIRVQI